MFMAKGTQELEGGIGCLLILIFVVGFTALNAAGFFGPVEAAIGDWGSFAVAVVVYVALLLVAVLVFQARSRRADEEALRRQDEADRRLYERHMRGEITNTGEFPDESAFDRALKARTSSAAARASRPSIPARVRSEVWRRDEGGCVDCGSKERLEYDHIIPLSRGGANTARNIELRCEVCHRAKGLGV
jgi:uncharacterized membrane protein